ncbi:hypothetical protein BDV95DRAFT_597301 [Massariosphaeria phaeospora]|uniref:Uncharacterized protein n=1 Tax=Massariosphaeria phaeospora TaxID=100035 RepID=A0A7C8M832_9PLEO|nr:hypothetical protein BDV95DRAFT_597301 [Massariosphaeria phaeospora]
MPPCHSSLRLHLALPPLSSQPQHESRPAPNACPRRAPYSSAQLVERGLLSLDALVYPHIPELFDLPIIRGFSADNAGASIDTPHKTPITLPPHVRGHGRHVAQLAGALQPIGCIAAALTPRGCAWPARCSRRNVQVGESVGRRNDGFPGPGARHKPAGRGDRAGGAGRGGLFERSERVCERRGVRESVADEHERILKREETVDEILVSQAAVRFSWATGGDRRYGYAWGAGGFRSDESSAGRHAAGRQQGLGLGLGLGRHVAHGEHRRGTGERAR